VFVLLRRSLEQDFRFWHDLHDSRFERSFGY
jgi:hypothetical protein